MPRLFVPTADRVMPVAAHAEFAGLALAVFADAGGWRVRARAYGRYEAEAHGLVDELAMFVDEQSPVTDALAYSDLTTGPAGERVSVSQRLGEIERPYGPGSLVVRALACASDALAGMVSRTEQRLASGSAPWEQTQP